MRQALKTVGGATIAVCLAVPALAQTPQKPPAKPPPATRLKIQKPPRDRGFLSLNLGAQLVSDAVTDSFFYQANVETATTEARYKAPAALLFDAALGMHVWKKRVGISIAGSHFSRGSTADTESSIPHPLFDDRHRQVSGEAQDLTRAETAVHLNLYYVKTSGRWRLLFSAGPSYFNVEQEVITAVTLTETYPYDTAEFRGVTSKRDKAAAAGINVGADIGWRLRRATDAGMLVRYAIGKVSFNVDGSHNVSSDAGGLQVAAGIRFRF